MTSTEILKPKPSEAEYAAEWFAVTVLGCVITRRVARSAKFQKVDFFASDIVGKRQDGSHVYIQATTGQYKAVMARRKKLEAIPWHATDRVFVYRLKKTLAESGRKKYYYNDDGFEYILSGDKQRIWESILYYNVPHDWLLPLNPTRLKEYREKYVTDFQEKGND